MPRATLEPPQWTCPECSAPRAEEHADCVRCKWRYNRHDIRLRQQTPAPYPAIRTSVMPALQAMDLALWWQLVVFGVVLVFVMAAGGGGWSGVGWLVDALDRIITLGLMAGMAYCTWRVWPVLFRCAKSVGLPRPEFWLLATVVICLPFGLFVPLAGSVALAAWFGLLATVLHRYGQRHARVVGGLAVGVLLISLVFYAPSLIWPGGSPLLVEQMQSPLYWDTNRGPAPLSITLVAILLSPFGATPITKLAAFNGWFGLWLGYVAVHGIWMLVIACVHVLTQHTISSDCTRTGTSPFATALMVEDRGARVLEPEPEDEFFVPELDIPDDALG